jgi:hypothetical protein
MAPVHLRRAAIVLTHQVGKRWRLSTFVKVVVWIGYYRKLNVICNGASPRPAGICPIAPD